MLVPNEQAYFDRATVSLEKRNVSSDEFLAWTSEILYLDHTPMREVMHTLEKWYNIRISLKNETLGNCPISGKYKNDRLLNILEGLKFAQGIDYHFTNENEIEVTGTTCTGQ
jgi:ferric-dicitrate binding protein FerR (iron transport regulator)